MASAAKQTGQIMLSYSLTTESLVREALKKFKEVELATWIDDENIGAGSSQIDSMGEGIGDASAVVVFYSRGYQRSPNCRLEAEHAFKLRKSIFFVRTEENYTPDGWLGFFIGRNLSYDITGDKFASEIHRLIKNMKDLSKQKVVPNPLSVKPKSKLGEGYVLLSYSGSTKEIVQKAKSKIQAAGLSTWMDDENAESASSMESVAALVDDAALVVVFYGSAFRKSVKSRMEAEYAEVKKKPILFVRAEKNYHPDGWLGILIGSYMYFDLFRDDGESVLQNLIARIKEKRT